MAAFSYHVQAPAPAAYLADTLYSPVQRHHIVEAAQNYQAAPGLTAVRASSSPCFPYYNYSPFPVPYYVPVKAQESRGSVDDSVISPLPSNQHQAREEVARSRSTSQGSLDAEKKRRQGKQGPEEPSNKMKKQRKNCGSAGRSNTNKGSGAAADAGGCDNNEAEASQEQPPPQGYIHVRARRGQATDSHSLAERVRREKISARMKLLQGLVPGCDKVTGKALMLDEIINYVQSLQHQVEFLSMKLASLSPVLYDFGHDLDVYMAQMQKVERLSPVPTVQPAQTGGGIAVQTPAAAVAAAAAFGEPTDGYNLHPVTAAVTDGSSVISYLLHGCHPNIPTDASYSPQESGNSSLMQVVAGDSTQEFLQQLQFAANNLCSFQ